MMTPADDPAHLLELSESELELVELALAELEHDLERQHRAHRTGTVEPVWRRRDEIAGRLSRIRALRGRLPYAL